MGAPRLAAQPMSHSSLPRWQAACAQPVQTPGKSSAGRRSADRATATADAQARRRGEADLRRSKLRLLAAFARHASSSVPAARAITPQGSLRPDATRAAGRRTVVKVVASLAVDLLLANEESTAPSSVLRLERGYRRRGAQDAPEDRTSNPDRSTIDLGGSRHQEGNQGIA
jgi:hypothetical protein